MSRSLERARDIGSRAYRPRPGRCHPGASTVAGCGRRTCPTVQVRLRDRIAAIRDYRYVPYLIDELALE